MSGEYVALTWLDITKDQKDPKISTLEDLDPPIGQPLLAGQPPDHPKTKLPPIFSEDGLTLLEPYRSLPDPFPISYHHSETSSSLGSSGARPWLAPGSPLLRRSNLTSPDPWMTSHKDLGSSEALLSHPAGLRSGFPQIIHLHLPSCHPVTPEDSPPQDSLSPPDSPPSEALPRHDNFIKDLYPSSIHLISLPDQLEDRSLTSDRPPLVTGQPPHRLAPGDHLALLLTTGDLRRLHLHPLIP